MPTQFENLPYEIQVEIFELAATAEYAPRVLEIFYKEGQLHSQQRPPALLHVCSLSRHVILKTYKPWLPQFVGSKGHEPWEKMAKKRGVERLSKLHNVCFDMDNDILLISSRICRPGMFGEIERQILRNMAVEMDGWITFLDIGKCVRQCGGLKTLNLFEGKNGRGHTEYKWTRIEAIVERLAKKKLRKKEMLYTIPQIRSAVIQGSDLDPKRWGIDEWYQYKYPKGYQTPMSTRLVDRSRSHEQHRTELELEELKEASVNQAMLGTRPRQTATATSVKTTTPTTKRKRYRVDAPQSSNASPRKSAKISHEFHPRIRDPEPTAASTAPASRHTRQLLTPPTSSPIRENQHTPRLLEPQHSTEPSYSNSFNREFFENSALSSSPEQSSNSPELPVHPRQATSSTQSILNYNPFHEWTELDWETLIQPSSSPDQFATPSITRFVDISSPSEQPAYIEPPRFWSALEDVSRKLNDTADMGRKYVQVVDEEEDETEHMLQLQLQAELGDEDQVDEEFEQEPEPSKAKVSKSKVSKFKVSKSKASRPKVSSSMASKSKAAISKTQKSKASKSKVPGPLTPDSEAPESSGVPARIRAERQAMDEAQLLIQWKGYPDEKDWTWEAEEDFKHSVPQMVKAWRAKKSKEDIKSEGVYLVKKILSKKKYKGQPHYLVKWEGYEEIEDRTWEPWDRLMVDVPEIVEAYESRKGKGRK